MEAFIIGLLIVVGVPLTIWLGFAFLLAWPIWVPVGIVAAGISIGSAAGGVIVAIGLAIGVVILAGILHITGIID